MDSDLKNDKIVFSIIIPVYNVEEYLPRCLNSVLKQEFKFRFEVIAIDDHSTDNSLNILLDYQKKYENLKIITNNKNKKLSFCRKMGIESSVGEYVLHVDSDDYILPNTLYDLYIVFKESNADVIVFNYIKNINGTVKLNNHIKSRIFTSEKNKVHDNFFGSVWNKASKRSILNYMIYGNIAINSSEDLIYCTELLLRAKSIYIIPEYYYSYSINLNSITSKISPINYLENQVNVLNELDKIFTYNNASSIFKKNVFNYFEKWVFLEIYKLHYINLSNKTYIVKLILDKFSQFSFIEKKNLNLYKKTVDCKIESAYQTYKIFGIRVVASIALKSYLKNY